VTIGDLNLKPTDKILREFGVISIFGFGLLGALAAWKWDAWTLACMLWATGVVALLLALLRPRMLRWLYVPLMVAAFPVGFVVSNMILFILYFGLFTPIALVFRVAGRDALRRKLQPDCDSYWIEKKDPRPVSQRFKQY